MLLDGIHRPLLYTQIVLILLICICSLHAQHQPPIIFDKLLTKDKSDFERIHDIVQGREGFIWIGTDKGLVRYDGQNVYKYNSDDKNQSLLGNKIYKIIEDPDTTGILWLATDNGISVFNWYENTFVNFFQDTSIAKLQTNKTFSIQCILVDSYKNIWFGTFGRGLLKFDRLTGEFITYRNDPENPASISFDTIEDIVEDENGDLWIATQRMELSKYLRNENIFLNYSRDQIALSDNRLTSLLLENDTTLWIGSTSGVLDKLNLNTLQVEAFELPGRSGKSLFMFDLEIDYYGTVWVTTFGGGLYSFNTETNKFTNYRHDRYNLNSLSNNKLSCLFIDKTGLLWIGTDGEGINMFVAHQNRFKNFTPKTPTYGRKSSQVYTIAQDLQGDIWLGYLFGGLGRFNPKTEEFKHFDSPKIKNSRKSGLKVSCLINDSQDMLWVGTYNRGLMIFDKKNEQFLKAEKLNQNFRFLKKSNIFHLYEDYNQDIWIVTTRKGTYRYNRKTGKIVRFKNPIPIEQKYFRANIIRQFEPRYMWLAALRKLIMYDLVNEKVVSIYPADKREETVSGQIRGIERDSKGHIWFVTSGGEIVRLANTNNQEILEIKSLKIKISSFLIDEYDNFWISTTDGLVHYNPESNQSNTFSFKDGLVEKNFTFSAHLRDRDNHLYFGHKSGITYFKPFDVEYNKIMPSIIVTNFRESQDVSPLDEHPSEPHPIISSTTLEYPYGNYVFFLEFTALDYVNPQGNQYAYMVEGLEKDWRYVGNRNYLSLVNLAPNEYNIRIKGASSRGVWNEDGISLKLIIHPPFWQTWWFTVLAIVTLIAFGYLVYYIRTREVKIRNLELEQINAQLKEQMTVRQKIESMLRESEEQYRALVSSIEQDIFTLNQDAKILFVNETMAAHHNAKSQALINKNVNDLFCEKSRGILRRNLQRVIEGGKGQNFAVQLLINGEKRSYHMSMQPVKDSKTTEKQVLVIGTDVTRQKDLEEQLRQAQKMEAIGKLAGGIAHDFNNLIAIIRGYSDLLLLDIKQDEEAYESVVEIDKAGERASILIRQLLAFSRRQILQPKIININEVIRDIEKMIGRLIREDIKMWMHLDPELGNVYADPGQIEQVILNLIVNARDAMPLGGTLTIETKNISPGNVIFAKYNFIKKGHYSVLEIADTGTGISKEVKEKIFEPFFTTKEKGEGTGLGLSTVFGIVKQSKGYVIVDSEVDRGSTFKILIPSVKDEVTLSQTPVKLSTDLQGDETILVVEDEESLKKMISKMLSLNGYHVLEAANGAEAIELSESFAQTIDLLLTDVVMPGMSGRDLSDILTDSREGLQTIYMSGYTDDEIVHQGVLFPDTHFIQKPFTPQALAELIRDVVNHKKANSKSEEDKV